MNLEDKINQRERDIGRIEGSLESLSTKEYVSVKFAEQLKYFAERLDELSKQIERERIWRMRITDAVSILALVFAAISSLVTILVNLGIIST